MTSHFIKDPGTYNQETVLNIESTATLLGVSTATIRNWVKGGHLKTLGGSTKCFFHKKNIEDVKLKILSGELKKLNKRANKTKAGRSFIPDEYMPDKEELEKLNLIVSFVKNNNINLFTSLFLVSLNLLKKEKILSRINIRNLIRKEELPFTNKQIKKEIESWFSEIKNGEIKEKFSFLLDCDIPKQCDVLGFLYQSLLAEGQKSQSGSYYTPANIINGIITEYVKKDSKVLDPCCGTGQFLLAFSDVIKDPSNIHGIDFDEIAVKIARLNILVRFKNKNFTPNIICKNTLSEVAVHDLFDSNDENIKDFDVIATNPPWGAYFSKTDSEKLKKLYPAIASSESFSYFLKKSIDLLNKSGVVSFILPESILNVKIHKDIRKVILSSTQIKKIIYLDRVFKNVFTPAIRLDLRKGQKESNNIKVRGKNKSHEIEQFRWLNNQDFIFDIHLNNLDTKIIDKIYKTKNTTLENKADWALGIVTGDNKKFITNKYKVGFEPIYKGKDVEKFTLRAPSSYIRFTPEEFQQVAPTKKYRAKEKLIYRFISKNLVFAYDCKQRLTLNSANIVIPKIPDYPIKVIAALLNSSLYQLIFQKKISSIKVLRGHIEQMPLPLWDGKKFSDIITLIDKTIENKNNFKKLDNYIMDQFALSPEEKNYIENI